MDLICHLKIERLNKSFWTLETDEMFQDKKKDKRIPKKTPKQQDYSIGEWSDTSLPLPLCPPLSSRSPKVSQWQLIALSPIPLLLCPPLSCTRICPHTVLCCTVLYCTVLCCAVL
jgi:hypothetical protein